MNINEVRILAQYVNSLEQASNDLEKKYFEKDIQGVENIKKFIKEVQSKISQSLNK